MCLALALRFLEVLELPCLSLEPFFSQATAERFRHGTNSEDAEVPLEIRRRH